MYNISLISFTYICITVRYAIMVRYCNVIITANVPHYSWLWMLFDCHAFLCILRVFESFCASFERRNMTRLGNPSELEFTATFQRQCLLCRNGKLLSYCIFALKLLFSSKTFVSDNCVATDQSQSWWWRSGGWEQVFFLHSSSILPTHNR